jgi:hypothetical protein
MISSLPFSSLSAEQRAQAAALFLDGLFGSLPEEYAYEIDAASGQLSGQRQQIGMMDRPGKGRGSHKAVVRVISSNLPRFDQVTARNFVRALGLANMKGPEQWTTPSKPTDELTVAFAAEEVTPWKLSMSDLK